MCRSLLSHSRPYGLPSTQAARLLLLLSVPGAAACELTGPDYREIERRTLTGQVTEAADPSVGIANVRVSTWSHDAALDDWGDPIETLTDSTGHYVVHFKRYCEGEGDLHLVQFSGTGWEYQGHRIPCSQSKLDVQMEPASSDTADARIHLPEFAHEK